MYNSDLVEEEKNLSKYLDCILSPHKKLRKMLFYPFEWFIENYRTNIVLPGSPIMSRRRCYNNSLEMMQDRYKYVEGFIILRGVPLSHAWNEDREGNWIDFTIPNVEEQIYFGTILPHLLVIEAASHKYWIISDGVLSTVSKFSDSELVLAKKLLES